MVMSRVPLVAAVGLVALGCAETRLVLPPPARPAPPPVGVAQPVTTATHSEPEPSPPDVVEETCDCEVAEPPGDARAANELREHLASLEAPAALEDERAPTSLVRAARRLATATAEVQRRRAEGKGDAYPSMKPALLRVELLAKRYNDQRYAEVQYLEHLAEALVMPAAKRGKRSARDEALRMHLEPTHILDEMEAVPLNVSSYAPPQLRMLAERSAACFVEVEVQKLMRGAAHPAVMAAEARARAASNAYYGEFVRAAAKVGREISGASRRRHP